LVLAKTTQFEKAVSCRLNGTMKIQNLLSKQSHIIRGMFPILLRVGVVLLVTGCTSPISEKKLNIDARAEGQPSENYRLTASDIVHVEVFQEPDMASEQRIAGDGTINIALIGRVKIAGQTLEGAADQIQARLSEGFLVNPQVTVSVLTYAPRKFTILGQVNGPGNYEIPSEEIVTLAEAVAMAGGNTRIGNLRSIIVTRERDDGVYEIKVNLLSPSGRQFIIKEGDLITVPESLF